MVNLEEMYSMEELEELSLEELNELDDLYYALWKKIRWLKEGKLLGVK